MGLGLAAFLALAIVGSGIWQYYRGPIAISIAEDMVTFVYRKEEARIPVKDIRRIYMSSTPNGGLVLNRSDGRSVPFPSGVGRGSLVGDSLLRAFIDWAARNRAGEVETRSSRLVFWSGFEFVLKPIETSAASA